MTHALTTRTDRSVELGYLLWFGWLLGPWGCGLHRLYSGRIVSGIIWMLTGGLCGFGQLIDLFFISRMVRDYNGGREVW